MINWFDVKKLVLTGQRCACRVRAENPETGEMLKFTGLRKAGKAGGVGIPENRENRDFSKLTGTEDKLFTASADFCIIGVLKSGRWF
jgi:hypothetical protein